MQRVNFQDGDYASDGTYWGYIRGEYLYCAYTRDLAVELYVRAGCRNEAIAKLREDYEDIRFYKGERA